MKNFLMVAAFAALTACGSSDTKDGGEAAQKAGADTPEPPASDWATAEIAGTYEVVAEDGTVVRQSVKADGTYVETIDGAETERGRWHQKGDQMCYDPQGDTIEQCYTGGRPAGDGSFSVETDGGTATVRRVEESQIAAPDAAQADTQ